MTPFEQKKLDLEFRSFLSRNFERPANCRDLEQLRSYISQLCAKIEEFKTAYDYVPGTAYWHLTEYNARQNVLVEQYAKLNQ